MIRIAITGPESTGKSWLTEALAKHFHLPFVSEYAREYLNRLGTDYGYADLIKIAQGQARLEEQTLAPVVLCDTDMMVLYVWAMYRFGKCPPFVQQRMDPRRYQLTLLCNIDLPWQYDPLREHPHAREEIFGLYKNALTASGREYAIVSGQGETRLRNGIQLVENFLSKANNSIQNEDY